MKLQFSGAIQQAQQALAGFVKQAPANTSQNQGANLHFNGIKAKPQLKADAVRFGGCCG